jgi:hypothetical protein
MHVGGQPAKARERGKATAHMVSCSSLALHTFPSLPSYYNRDQADRYFSILTALLISFLLVSQYRICSTFNINRLVMLRNIFKLKHLLAFYIIIENGC